MTEQERQKEIKEIKERLVGATRVFNEVKDHYQREVEKEKEAMILLAKYKPGDKVIYRENRWRRENDGYDYIPGIIRSTIVKADRDWTDYTIQYFVAKVTKAGAAHKSQNVSYWGINEENLFRPEDEEVKGKVDGQ